MTEKSAAIPPDEIGEAPLAKLSAAEFLSALQKEKALDLIGFWPEKKKYELEIEPVVVERIRFREFIDIIRRIRGEKKKAEREIADWWRWRVYPELGGADLEARVEVLTERLDALADKIDSTRRG